MNDFFRRRLFAVISLGVSILLVAGVLTFAGPCMHDDGSVSVCFGASRAVIAAGVVAAAASLVAVAVRNGKVAGALAIVAALAGAFAAAAPGTLFDLCMMQTMRCWTAMRPFALVCGIVICACAVVAAVQLFRGEGRAA